VKAGDVVKVRVVEVDLKRKRIALSMRKDEESSQRVVVASSEVAAKNHIRQQAPHQKKSMLEGALGAALSEALRRK